MKMCLTHGESQEAQRWVTHEPCILAPCHSNMQPSRMLNQGICITFGLALLQSVTSSATWAITELNTTAAVLCSTGSALVYSPSV